MSMIAQGDIQDNDFSYAYHKGKKAGIKEVVEWINETDILVMLSPRKRREWQAKLKSWNISA